MRGEELQCAVCGSLHGRSDLTTNAVLEKEKDEVKDSNDLR